MLVLVGVVLVVSLAALGVSLLTLREVRRARSVSPEQLDAGLKALRQHGHQHHRETRAITDALFSLSSLGRAGSTTPSTQGWSASPMVLRRLAETVTTTDPKLVVELGGGGSSVLLGRLLRDHLGGDGRVVSFDHDPDWAEITREHLRRHRLEDVVEVRVAPLIEVEVDGQTFSWYETSALADLTDVDLVFVDGPPGSTGKHARFPALPVLRDSLRPGAVVLLDDGGRRQERAVADRWIADHGAVEVACDDVGTGWIELRIP